LMFFRLPIPIKAGMAFSASESGTMRPMPTSPPKRGGWTDWTLAALVLLPVLYVLGYGALGSAVIHWNRIPDWSKPIFVWATRIYRPTHWLADSNETVDRLAFWYLNLWP
jgi:hypothetical protein